MEDQLKQVLRRLESIEKTLNLQHKDRDIFEDISIRLGTVEDKLRLLTERVDKGNKNMVSEVSDMADKIEEVKDQLNV